MNQRMCVVCRNRKDKSQLVRIENNNGIVVIADKKNNGTRGTYICYGRSCIQKCEKNKILNRVLKIDVPQDLYTKIKDYIEGKTNAK